MTPLDLPIPLADLHRHLDGSLRPATVEELAARDGLDLPPDLAFFPGMGLSEALARFAFTLKLLRTPERVCRVAAEICEDAAAEGVTTLEIRFAPQLHPGATPEAIVDAALAGIDGRAGLILCGLYGEPPGQLDRLVEIAGPRPGVVGLDLAGGPSPDHRWTMSDYGGAFRRAAELGLGRTVHAAEGRGPEEIRVAVEELGAQRIGHGTTLLEDPRVLELVLERQVTIEACPSSNVHVGVIERVADHPLPRWLRAGVQACVCTDNTLLSAVDASEELKRCAAIPGMNHALIQQAVSWGHAAAFQRS
ncbi:MAG: adenosine deaminase family protein [Myxococcota bacterium]|nr:adenosine deaminase family protein [Myxococcota bacterium]